MRLGCAGRLLETRSVGGRRLYRARASRTTVATFEDLVPLTYFGPQAAAVLVAVGWLGRESSFRTGPVTGEFYERLKQLMARRFSPIVCAGGHACELCQFDPAYGSGNLFVPEGNRLLVCPELVVHYIAKHHYQPPEVFCGAVLRCHDPGGSEYRKQFLRAGGRLLISPPANRP